MAERPSLTDIRKARKAQLVAWCEEFGLDPEGTVEVLRDRLRAHVKAPPEEEKPAREEEPEAEKIEGETEVAAEAEAEEREEAEEEEEAKEKPFTPKAKPQLEPTVQNLLRIRAEIAKRRPAFRRQEWFRYKRLGDAWRKPQGRHTKLRRHFGYRPNVPSIGYRGPKAVRGLHPSGFREVLVHTVQDLEAIDSKFEAARVAGSVGLRRRLEIQAVADEKGIRVLNRREEE